jgi:hypothetical protein
MSDALDDQAPGERNLPWAKGQGLHRAVPANLMGEWRFPPAELRLPFLPILNGLLLSLGRVVLLELEPIHIALTRTDDLEILDDRQGHGATLITSQFLVAQWHEVIADPTVADAILDRLAHNAYRLEFGGKSTGEPKNPSDKQS